MSCFPDPFDSPIDFYSAKEALLLYITYFSVILECLQAPFLAFNYVQGHKQKRGVQGGGRIVAVTA